MKYIYQYIYTRKWWKTREDGLCCSSSAIQTRLGPSSLLEKRSEIPIVFVVFFFCVVGYPPNLGKRPRYIDIHTCAHTLGFISFLTLKPWEFGIWNKTTLNRQQREFRIWNNTQKTKENNVRMILCSRAYITQLRLTFCMSTGVRERKFSLKKKI